MGINFKGFAVQVQWLFIVLVAWLLVETEHEIGIALASGHFDDDVESSSKFNRSCFPKGFIFGTAAAAYQYEGAAAEDGRGPSIWDTFTHKYPGLQPFVTIFHWDLPQALEDDYGGFLSPRIVADFQDYAELCFKEFGDRVKHWITLNEPHSYSSNGYNKGTDAPGRCSKWVNKACQAGNSSTEPYIVGHHQLLSHAAAVKVYKEKYQAIQKGKIGITLISDWMVPYSNEKPNVEAADRALDFFLGMYMDPLIYGNYPFIMRTLVRERLPKFANEQSVMLKGSFDFIGMNYYSSNYAVDIPVANSINISYSTDSQANLTAVRNGKLIGPKAASNWLYVYPRGFRDLLIYIKEKYNNPTLYITENGYDDFNNATLPLKEALKDPMRLDYFKNHLLFLRKAIKEGVNVKGYFAWSLLDNFEWYSGYSVSKNHIRRSFLFSPKEVGNFQAFKENESIPYVCCVCLLD
ncbi:Beta-glucosidase 13 [Citrus sinensis]|nr:Beta-glucosidase 13 [Citrus sinensis]